MNFAYIDAQSIFESLIRPEPNTVQSIPCDIEGDWVNFEKELGKFKEKYAHEQVELAQKVHELNEKLEEVNTLKTASVRRRHRCLDTTMWARKGKGVGDEEGAQGYQL